MNRRAFLKGAPIAAVSLAAGIPASGAPAGYERLSVEPGDPGYVPLAKLNGDGVKVKVFLNDVEQGAITVDASEGWMKRYVMTDKGNHAHSRGELVTEVVHGKIRIELS